MLKEIISNPYLMSLLTSVCAVLIYILFKKYKKQESNHTEYLKIFSIIFLITIVIYLCKGDIKIPIQKGGSIEDSIMQGEPNF